MAKAKQTTKTPKSQQIPKDLTSLRELENTSRKLKREVSKTIKDLVDKACHIQAQGENGSPESRAAMIEGLSAVETEYLSKKAELKKLNQTIAACKVELESSYKEKTPNLSYSAKPGPPASITIRGNVTANDFEIIISALADRKIYPSYGIDAISYFENVLTLSTSCWSYDGPVVDDVMTTIEDALKDMGLEPDETSVDKLMEEFTIFEELKPKLVKE
jgi:hypothetical protein